MEAKVGELSENTVSLILGYATKLNLLLFLSQTPTYAIPVAILYSPLLAYEMVNTI